MLWTLALALTIHAHAADKSACSSRELSRRDCRLSSGAHKMRLLPDTIARDDGVWHTVDEIPLNGDWEKIRFEKLGGRQILQLWIWDQGAGEVTVQSLHWYVAEAGKSKLRILAEGVVRRRRMNPEQKPAKYIYDAWEKHELKAQKSGDLAWKLGTQSKILKPEVHNGI